MNDSWRLKAAKDWDKSWWELKMYHKKNRWKKLLWKGRIGLKIWFRKDKEICNFSAISLSSLSENVCMELRICWHFATCQNKNNNSELLHSSCCMSVSQKAPDCLGDLRNKLTQINQTFFYTLPYTGQWHPGTTFAVLIGRYPKLKDQNWQKSGLKTEI